MRNAHSATPESASEALSGGRRDSDELSEERGRDSDGLTASSLCLPPAPTHAKVLRPQTYCFSPLPNLPCSLAAPQPRPRHEPKQEHDVAPVGSAIAAFPASSFLLVSSCLASPIPSPCHPLASVLRPRSRRTTQPSLATHSPGSSSPDAPPTPPSLLSSSTFSPLTPRFSLNSHSHNTQLGSSQLAAAKSEHASRREKSGAQTEPEPIDLVATRSS